MLYTNKTDRHDITEILLEVALNTKTKPIMLYVIGATTTSTTSTTTTAATTTMQRTTEVTTGREYCLSI